MNTLKFTCEIFCLPACHSVRDFMHTNSLVGRDTWWDSWSRLYKPCISVSFLFITLPGVHVFRMVCYHLFRPLSFTNPSSQKAMQHMEPSSEDNSSGTYIRNNCGFPGDWAEIMLRTVKMDFSLGRLVSWSSPSCLFALKSALNEWNCI